MMFNFFNGINRIKAEYNEITVGKDYNHMDNVHMVMKRLCSTFYLLR